MADCQVNPSFLRGFDFKLLHASSGLDEYRVMSLNPLNGEIIAAPYGHMNFLCSDDWGYTFEDLAVTGLDAFGPSLVVYDSNFGLNRHALAFIKDSKNLDPVYSVNMGTILLPTNLTEATGFTPSSGGSPTYGGGMAYGNGAFYHYMLQTNAYVGGIRWYNDAWTVDSPSNTGSTPWISVRWPKTKGQWVYAVFFQYISNSNLQAVGIGRRPFPARSPAEFVSYFVDENTTLEVADFIDYTAVVEDGAAMILRDGTIWHNTGENYQTWVEGVKPPVEMSGYSFPHLAAGKGKFNEDVLLSLDSSGTVGLLSLDHGATQTYFDLPLEITQTLPGGSVPAAGTVDSRYPRVYDLKYIPDPQTNFTKGRWVFCGGMAIWELIPRYGA